MVNPYAYFDSLFISIQVQDALGSVTAGEIHLLAYLARLLSLYRPMGAGYWKYEFANTPRGAPFSREVAQAIDDLRTRGFLWRSEGGVLQVTPQGEGMDRCLSTLEQNAERRAFLEAACLSLSVFPVGMIRQALSQEPGLSHARVHGLSRPLLDEWAVENLDQQFTTVRNAMGKGTDLALPAIVWLTYLASMAYGYEPC